MSTGPTSAHISSYCAEFRLRTDKGPQILLACDPDGVAAAIATIMATELVQVPTVLVRDRPGYEAGSRPDHGLKIAIDPVKEVGALAYFGPGGEDYGPGAWVSYSALEHHPEVKLYRDTDAASTFPSDSHLVLNTLARAVEDFRATGGLRPGLVAWRPSTIW